MSQQVRTDPVKTDRYIEHLKACAETTNQIALILGLRDDAAKQSCFATLIINADRYGVFMEPKDQNGPIKTNGHATKSDSQIKDEQAAQKADAQIADIDPDPTEEKAESAERKAFIAQINDAVRLLNEGGHTPAITLGGLNVYIKSQFPEKTLDDLSVDELGQLTEKLCDKLKKQKAKQKPISESKPLTVDDIDF